ncbi:MAG TPA: arginase family protein [Gemmatimonadales bacterium]|nr:arginase family protein [Gemmatimonadales bacterium]
MRNQFLLTPYTLDAATPDLVALARPGWQVTDPGTAGDGQLGRISGIHHRLADLVSDSVRGGARPVSVAGDCCAAIPVLAGLQRAGLHPVVLWLDAHGDFNTATTTITGFLGGMPLAMMSGRGDQTLMQAVGAHLLLDDDIILSDARDLDPAERALLDGSGVRRPASVSGVIEAIPPHRPVYVHLDFDLLRPEDAPAMRYSVPGGPSLAELTDLGTALRATGRVIAVSATTWDLAADRDGRTGAACMRALETFLSTS